MQYCAKKTCPGSQHFYEDDDVACSKCKGDLTPCIRCLCGEEDFNPYWGLPKACPACGALLSVEYLGQCMAVQLDKIVKIISVKMAKLN